MDLVEVAPSCGMLFWFCFSCWPGSSSIDTLKESQRVLTQVISSKISTLVRRSRLFVWNLPSSMRFLIEKKERIQNKGWKQALPFISRVPCTLCCLSPFLSAKGGIPFGSHSLSFLGRVVLVPGFGYGSYRLLIIYICTSIDLGGETVR